jgi:hypothetical protein
MRPGVTKVVNEHSRRYVWIRRNQKASQTICLPWSRFSVRHLRFRNSSACFTYARQLSWWMCARARGRDTMRSSTGIRSRTEHAPKSAFWNTPAFKCVSATSVDDRSLLSFRFFLERFLSNSLESETKTQSNVSGQLDVSI